MAARRYGEIVYVIGCCLCGIVNEKDRQVSHWLTGKCMRRLLLLGLTLPFEVGRVRFRLKGGLGAVHEHKVEALGLGVMHSLFLGLEVHAGDLVELGVLGGRPAHQGVRPTVLRATEKEGKETQDTRKMMMKGKGKQKVGFKWCDMHA